MAVFLHLKSVYPYVYREHFALESTAENINGLSLCVQGTLTSIRSLIFCNRFIPMCIGNTLPKQTHQLLAPVYPYVYREHVPTYSVGDHVVGLSLCVQGTRLPFLPFFFTSTVYPYVYREHNHQSNLSKDNYGLSLCVQGTHHCLWSEQSSVRFIPMCTGNTRSIYALL